MKFSSFILILILFFYYGCERLITNNKPAAGFPPAVPSTPVIYSAHDGSVFLLWKPNAEADLSGYNVYRSIDSLNFSKIGFTTNNSYYDDSLNYTTKYFYRITAIDIYNQESQPSGIVSATPVNYYPPITPSGLTINARNWQGEKSIYLEWSPNTESDVAGYNIYKSTSSSFTADSTAFIAFTSNVSYSDTLNLELYRTYYYKIKAIDKGGLLSDSGPEVHDEIFGIPEMIFPEDNSKTGYFSQFIIKAISSPASYKVILQNNQYFNQVWSNEISTTKINDTLYIPFTDNIVNRDQTYYWRVITYSPNGSGPNSISPLYKFVIRQGN